jgi:hypothetical protein
VLLHWLPPFSFGTRERNYWCHVSGVNGLRRGGRRLPSLPGTASRRTPVQEDPLRPISVKAPLALIIAGTVVAAACNLTTPPPSGTCSKVATYTVGDTARDSLASDDCRQSDGTYIDFYNVDIGAQASLRLALSSPTNPAILQVFDSRGAIIANSYAETTVADTSAALRVILAPGSYGIGVRASQSGARGPYRLIVADDTARVGGCGFVWVTAGITTSGQILNTDCNAGPGGTTFLYHVYTIVLLNTQTLDITEHSTAFAPQLVLVGATTVSYSTVDTTGANAIISYLSAGQGAYTLWVGSSSAAALGDYTLTLQ